MESDDYVLSNKYNEIYTLLYNKKTVKNRSKFYKLNPYITKYDIEVIPLRDYFYGKLKHKIKQLDELADSTVDADLNLAGLSKLLTSKISDKSAITKEMIVNNPDDYLKSFILVIQDEWGEVLEVIPNNNDKTTPGGLIARYFEEMYF